MQSLHGLWAIWFHLGATQQYYPLLHSAFWIEHRLWGDSVLGYHLLNVLLHALAACLVVANVRRLEIPGAWLAGLLFAVHPLCVESVAWISEQKTTLSAVFYLAAALLYLRSRYRVALLLFILALLTKTVTATLPATLLVIVWWRYHRIDWKPLLPWFIIGAAAGLFTASVEKTQIGAEAYLTPLQRLLLAPRAILFYLDKVIWPANLTFFYPRWNIELSQWWFPVGVIALGVVTYRNRNLFAPFLIFVITLFPVLGFLDIYPFRYSYVADHFAYLAMIPVLVMVSLVGQAIRLPSLSILLAAILAILTFRQAATYRNEETLYRATIASNPDAWLAHNNLANLLTNRAEARSHIETAIRLNPDFWEAHLSLGNALLETDLSRAIAEYETAARLAPSSERAHTNLGNALLQAGRTFEAIAHLQTAIHLDPTNADAHNDLGNAFAQLNRVPEAMAEYRAAIGANPNFAEPHNNLGRTLAISGDLPSAIAEFQTAIRIRPDSWSAHNNLGNALSRIPNRLPEAIAEYRTALRLRPDSAAAQHNLQEALRRGQ